MNKQERRAFICAIVLMVVSIPLLAIVTKLTFDVVVKGVDVECIKQYEPVCNVFMGLIVFIAIIGYFIAGDKSREIKGGEKNETQ